MNGQRETWLVLSQDEATALGHELLAAAVEEDVEEVEHEIASRSKFDSFGPFHEERGRRTFEIRGHAARTWQSVQTRRGETREPLTVVEIDEEWTISTRMAA